MLPLNEIYPLGWHIRAGIRVLPPPQVALIVVQKQMQPLIYGTAFYDIIISKYRLQDDDRFAVLVLCLNPGPNDPL